MVQLIPRPFVEFLLFVEFVCGLYYTTFGFVCCGFCLSFIPLIISLFLFKINEYKQTKYPE